MPWQRDRALVTAVLLSLAVHALALFGQLPEVRRMLESAAPSSPIIARLAQPESAEPEKKAEPPPPAPPKPRERPPQAEKPPPVAAAKSEIPAPAREVPAPEQAAAPAAAVSPPQTVSAASASAHARAAATEAAFAQTIGQYRLQILGAAGAFNRYPPLARENNWEGAVDVQMRVRGDGSLGALSVKRGSGHDVLDEQALDMFRQAQERVPLPPALRGREFTIDLKAVYRLKDREPG
jgi:protein TonB